jgi:hypothetical protein
VPADIATRLERFDLELASLYAYFGATAVIFVLVPLMPPCRPMPWLNALTKSG